MSVETRKILEMVVERKITAEDAEKLLDKLSSSAPPREGLGPASETSPRPNQAPRYFRIVVDQPGRDQVNIRVPLNFVRGGVKLMSLLPPQLSQRLAASEKQVLSIFSTLEGQDLENALRDLNVDVSRAGGKRVRIFCE